MFADLRREVNLLEVTVLQSLEREVQLFEETHSNNKKTLQKTGQEFSENLRRRVEGYCSESSQKLRSTLELLLHSFHGLFKASLPQASAWRDLKPEAQTKQLFDPDPVPSDFASTLHSQLQKPRQSPKMNFTKTQPIVLKDVNFETLHINKFFFEQAKSREHHSATKHRIAEDERLSIKCDLSRAVPPPTGSTHREDRSTDTYMKDAMARLFGASSKGLSALQRPKSAQKETQPPRNFALRNAGVSPHPMVKSQHLISAPPMLDSRPQLLSKKLPLENLNHTKLVRTAAQVGTSRESNMFQKQILEIKQSFNKSMQRRKL